VKFPQTATYWAPGTVNIDGEQSPGAPVQLNVRWEDNAERKIIPSGEEVFFKSKVYSEVDLEVNGYLYLGTTADTNPRNVNAELIRVFDKVPNLTGTKYVRKSML
jgi:hypothetical protein